MPMPDVIKKQLIQAVCSATNDLQTLEIARWWEMNPKGHAAAHLDHYLAGTGSDLPVDLALVLKDDGGVRQKVHADGPNAGLRFTHPIGPRCPIPTG